MIDCNYNQKLIKDSIISEISNLADDVDNGTYKIPCKNFITNAIGTILGLILCDIIGIETLNLNKGLKFWADVVIFVVMIILANLVVMGFSKLMKAKSN